MARTPGLRERKQAQVKRELYDSAIALFTEKGFEQTTVEEIAARVNVSRGTFFNYYGRKESVLLYYSEDLQLRVEAAIAARDPGTGPLDPLWEVLHIITETTAANREVVQMIYRHCPLDGGYLPGLTSARMRIFDLTTELVDEAQCTRALRTDMDARTLALYILGTVEFAIIAYMGGLSPMEPLWEGAWRFITGGAGPQPSGVCNPAPLEEGI